MRNLTFNVDPSCPDLAPHCGEFIEKVSHNKTDCLQFQNNTESPESTECKTEVMIISL